MTAWLSNTTGKTNDHMGDSENDDVFNEMITEQNTTSGAKEEGQHKHCGSALGEKNASGGFHSFARELTPKTGNAM